MPSLNRPNAPNRLPSSDFNNPFSKPRISLGFEAENPIATPSPLTVPKNYIFGQRRALRSSEPGNVSSPLASPSIIAPQQRPRLLQRQKYRSDASVVSDTSNESEKKPEVNDEESIQIKPRTASVSSSISERTREILGISKSPGPESNPQSPNEAKSGLKWSHDFLGGWLEIRVGRQGNSISQPAGASSISPPLSLSKASTIRIPLSRAASMDDLTDPDRRQDLSAASMQRLLPETSTVLESQDEITVTKEGFYCRTKRALGLKTDTFSPYLAPQSQTPTDRVLDRVSSTLQRVPPRTNTAASTATSSDRSIASPRKAGRRLALSSASSSIRDLLMGKPPPGTPEPELMYTGADGHQYPSIVVSETDALAFLPSEARRINTPPLPHPSPKGELRGFFFDYNVPPLDENPRRESATSNEPASRRTSSTPKGGEKAARPTETDWYRVKMDAIEAAESHEREEFVSSVPDHLPNSPLCPRHPKNRKTQGKGICPRHGKNKSMLSKSEQVEKTPSPKVMTPGSPPENWWYA